MASCCTTSPRAASNPWQSACEMQPAMAIQSANPQETGHCRSSSMRAAPLNSASPHSGLLTSVEFFDVYSSIKDAIAHADMPQTAPADVPPYLERARGYAKYLCCL